MSDNRLDLFKEVLPALSSGNYNYYNTLTDEQRKQIQPYVLMRWLTGATHYGQPDMHAQKSAILYVANLLNPFVWTLQKHKVLIFYLLVLCAPRGKGRGFKWIPSKSSKGASGPIKVIMQYYQYSFKKAKDVFPLLSDDEIVSYAMALAYDKEDIRKLKADLKKRETEG